MSSFPLNPGIQYDAERRIWALVTEQSMYAFGVTEENFLLHLHWGGRLHAFSDLPAAMLPPERSSFDPALTMSAEEYPPFGGLHYNELAAMVTFADGTRDLDLRFHAAEMGERNGLPALTVLLQDTIYSLEVRLYYSLDVDNDLIIRSASFSNTGQDLIALERAFSAMWHLPCQLAPRTLTTLAGQWLSEDHIQQRPLVAGTELIESRTGSTGAIHAPWFAISSLDPEQSGETYFGTLAWSGNWAMRIRTTIFGATAITGGIHDHDFRWELPANAVFETPEFVAGFVQKGLNAARHRLHRYTREHVLPQSHVHEPRPVLYNSWEATSFDVNEPGQRALAERAASLGVELFVDALMIMRA
jgi:alpha-galactosidase